jgi:phenylacetate-coenzyme A ligase PaaK-like adenylate-forming protein
MIDFSKWHLIPPYSLRKSEKSEMLTAALNELTVHHEAHCEPYRNILAASGYNSLTAKSYLEIPFLPVRLFKELKLLSVQPEEVFKTMTSSGTSGQSVSQIYLDKTTAANQTKALTHIVADFIGDKRMPMIVIDSPNVVKDRSLFSARGAGILGFSIFAKDRIFGLDEKMGLDISGVNTFLEKHNGQQILLFGFTYMVWQHLYKELARTGSTLDLSNAVLIHGGGWKKMVDEKVESSEFRKKLNDLSGLKRVHDYYGMVEQTGSIYLECEQGHLHTSIYSDVITRKGIDFEHADFGEVGVIEVVSILPTSYPGHALLTEDEGIILGEDDCSCGRLGKYFRIIGRIKNAEPRGCSDTYVMNPLSLSQK